MQLKQLLAIDISSYNRAYGLDILRALAILSVVIGHGNNILARILPIQTLQIIQFDGVSFFFVLSGFLIGSILIKTVHDKPYTAVGLINFWLRRWLRTLPNYFLILSILVIAWYFLKGQAPPQLLRYFVFSQNFVTPHPPFYPEVWSLSIEEWFYILIPLYLFLLITIAGTGARKALIFTITFIVILSTVLRYIRADLASIDDLKTWDLLLRRQVITRLDSIMYGMLGAYLSTFHKSLWLRCKKQCLVLGIVLVLMNKSILYTRDILWFSDTFGGVLNHYANILSFSTVAIGILLTLPYLSDLKGGKGPVFTFFTYISLISYSMYLIHASLIQGVLLPLFDSFLPQGCRIGNTLIKYAVYWSLTITGSILLYKYFEKPVTDLREHLSIKKSSTASQK